MATTPEPSGRVIETITPATYRYALVCRDGCGFLTGAHAAESLRMAARVHADARGHTLVIEDRAPCGNEG